MLFCLASWIVMAVSGLAVGSAILELTPPSRFPHIGDRVITATWLGVLVTAALLLGMSVLVPLSPVTGLGLMLVLTAVAACNESVRQDFRTVVVHLTKPV